MTIMQSSAGSLIWIGTILITAGGLIHQSALVASKLYWQAPLSHEAVLPKTKPIKSISGGLVLKMNDAKKGANNVVLGPSWRCDAIPGYHRLCTQNETIIRLEALLHPPTQIPVWKPPRDLTPYFEHLVGRIFQPFPTITSEDIRHLMNNKNCEEPLKFKIENGTVFVAPPEFTTIDSEKRGFTARRKLHPLKNINTLLKREGGKLLKLLPYLEGVICIGDGPPDGPGWSLVWNTQYEATKEHDFVRSSDKSKRTGIPMPLMEFSTPLGKWDRMMNETFTWRHAYPFQNRTRKAIFRGGGRTCHPKHGDELAREVGHDANGSSCGRWHLKEVANNHTTILDVAIDEDFIPMRDQEQFTMILLVEGHMGWANRLATQLAMENVILRQFNNPFEEWYSAFLEPFVHYVPVDHLFQFLPEVVQWCLDHDDMVPQISKNADEYAKTLLTVESQMMMLRMILEEYGRRYQHTEKSSNEQWVRFESLEEISYALMDEVYIKSSWA